MPREPFRQGPACQLEAALKSHTSKTAGIRSDELFGEDSHLERFSGSGGWIRNSDLRVMSSNAKPNTSDHRGVRLS
jgi:hypothetical protein